VQLENAEIKNSSGVLKINFQSEFSYIGEIGKGGFGEVIKVKNNLDSQVYAIKRIRLDPNNKQLTKKIMREVKLLSRLNHENVVRSRELLPKGKAQYG
jgi:translation initiation factor 2-alpha kinase 4